MAVGKTETSPTEIGATDYGVANAGNALGAIKMQDFEGDHFRVLLEFGDHVRSLVHPQDVMAAGLETAGTYCGVSRSVYSEIDEAEDYLTVQSTWTNGRLDTITGHAMSHFGPVLVAMLNAGQTVWSDDVQRDERLVHGSSAAFAELGVGAVLSVPMVRDGHLVASLCLHEKEPHRWTEVAG